ncbi:MAG: TonB-dependent receptor plug domain-containing protein, partial [bacterium]|nr:TonB-dependent receptor plug domain-containing protein [bacterium]
MKKFTLLAAVLWAALSFAYGQHYLKGIIINAESGKALQGAAIVNSNEKTGAYSDQSGGFSLRVNKFPVRLTVSHIGYAEKMLECGEEYCRIALEPVVLHAEEVFVTAQRAIDGKTPVAMSVLNREDIDLLYHRQDVPLVLEMEPGVYAYSDAGDGTGYSYLNIRGFTQDRIGVLYNGVPLNDPEAHAVYWVDHGDILQDASDVQVQRGTGNSLASGSFGGIVNVES